MDFTLMEKYVVIYMGENLLRCITQDKKGLVLIVILFYPLSPYQIMNQNLSKFSKGLYFRLLKF
jgi:hypothetical protein